jgi:hypothetical protein
MKAFSHILNWAAKANDKGHLFKVDCQPSWEKVVQNKVLFEAMGRRIRARNDELVNIISSCFIYCDGLIVRS